MKNLTAIFYVILSINVFAQRSDNLTPTPRPVQLVYFEGYAMTDSVYLRWGTATEVQNWGYNVQRSLDSIEGFETFAFVPGNGNSNFPHYYDLGDTNVEVNNTYYYRLDQIDYDGSHHESFVIQIPYFLIGVKDKPKSVKDYNILQNYPNPFNPSTNIKFTLEKGDDVSLIVYNILGQPVKELVNKYLNSGEYTLKFDASGLAAGIYFCRLKKADKVCLIKMLYLK